jgi:hypothetical protein
LFFGHRYSDLGPFRAIRRDLLDAIAMQDRRYGWTVEMQIRALQLGARVCEVPVRYRRRRGRSKISGTLGGSAKAGYWILRTIFLAAMRRRRSDIQWGRVGAPGRPTPASSTVPDRSLGNLARVRVRSLPPLDTLPSDTRAAFSYALGKTFEVAGVGPYGHLELELGPEADRLLGGFMNTIWIEPEHTEPADERSVRASRSPL